MEVIVEEKKCLGCAICVLTCPQDAIRMPSSFIAFIDREKCNQCRECLYFCPADALKEA